MLNLQNILSVFLIFVPVSIAGHFLHWSDPIVFITAALAIIPLAAWMGTATEEIAVVMGPALGGLLNATFGNATELIIALVALNAGLKYKEQTFQPIVARVNASSLNLAVIAMLLPTAVDYTSTGISTDAIQKLSIAVSIVLIGVYGLTLLFSMKTHTYLYDIDEADMDLEELADSNLGGDNEHGPVNLPLWITVLLACTLLVAVESEFLVSTLEVATEQLGLTALFTGVILVPIVGNAAEHATAVTVAMKDKMDLSVSVALGSSLQIALFVAPVLVLAGYIMGKPMNLNFNPFELVAVGVSVLIANSISSDGRSNWLEGSLLLAAYCVLGFAFYFHPVIDGIG
jgi:Ca2+:H+ antiporter